MIYFLLNYRNKNWKLEIGKNWKKVHLADTNPSELEFREKLFR